MVGITIPADPMTGFIHELITALPSQEADHVPTVQLHYHEGVTHIGVPCGQEYPHVDKRLTRLVVNIQLLTTFLRMERWFVFRDHDSGYC